VSKLKAWCLRGLVLLLVTSSPAATALGQSLGGLMSDLTHPDDYALRRISSFDPSGANNDFPLKRHGKGGARGLLHFNGTGSEFPPLPPVDQRLGRLFPVGRPGNHGEGF
jgi:hypothetical protein